MTLKIGDFVEVIDSVRHTGKRGVIVGYNPKALGSDWVTLYSGWLLSPEIRNVFNVNIVWRSEQLKKIEPPDFEVESETEEEDALSS